MELFFPRRRKNVIEPRFLGELKKLGITHDPSVPYTVAQNGHAGKLFFCYKIKALRIEADLPGYLWNQAIQTAGTLQTELQCGNRDGRLLTSTSTTLFKYFFTSTSVLRCLRSILGI